MWREPKKNFACWPPRCDIVQSFINISAPMAGMSRVFQLAQQNGFPSWKNFHSSFFFWGTNVHNFRNSQQIIFVSVLHRLYKQQDFCLSNSIIDLLQTFTRSQSIWIGKRIPKTLNHRTGSPVGIFKRVGYQMSMLIPFMVGVTWK